LKSLVKNSAELKELIFFLKQLFRYNYEGSYIDTIVSDAFEDKLHSSSGDRT